MEAQTALHGNERQKIENNFKHSMQEGKGYIMPIISKTKAGNIAITMRLKHQHFTASKWKRQLSLDIHIQRTIFVITVASVVHTIKCQK
jgi:hypothetical protein